MDKLEYIPGDLVIYASLIKEPVAEICEVHEASYTIKFMHGNFAKVTSKEIKPITLTSEILEKNGWVKDTHHHCLDEIPAEAYEKKDFPLTYFNVTFGKKRIQASHDSLFVRNLKYVSDLQHLLFGLGINYEMEV